MSEEESLKVEDAECEEEQRFKLEVELNKSIGGDGEVQIFATRGNEIVGRTQISEEASKIIVMAREEPTHLVLIDKEEPKVLEVS
jgi:hypothetical protein